jgi:hypothetical protein
MTQLSLQTSFEHLFDLFLVLNDSDSRLFNVLNNRIRLTIERYFVFCSLHYNSNGWTANTAERSTFMPSWF